MTTRSTGPTGQAPRHTVQLTLWGAAIYLALGALGISFAMAPGYASPIFPAAGFAVAYLLWAGSGRWPAVWLGSFALNIGIALLHSNLSARSIAVALGVASATTWQALLARALVLRSTGDGWRTLEEERTIVRCLVLAGPVACLVASSLAIPLLAWAQLIAGADWLNAWWNWWSGDVLGVLIVMPLSVALLQRRHASWRHRLSTLVPPMLVALAVVAAAFIAASKWERLQHIQIISRQGETLSKLLTQRFIAHQEALSALRRLLEVTPDMDYAKFEYFTRITLQDNPDIFALSINPYVQAPQRTRFERDMVARAAMPGFEIKERDTARRLVRAGERADYVPVGLIAPLQGNKPAIGFDINSDPVRHDAIERARQSRAPAVTAAVQLVQDNLQRVGVLVLHPAYTRTAAGQVTPDALLGFAVGVIKLDQMVDIATRESGIRGLVFRIDDVRDTSNATPLYTTQPGTQPCCGELLWQQNVTMADRVWRLSVYPDSAFTGTHSHWGLMAVGAGGLALVALLQVLLLVTTGNTAVVERKVQEQTAQLQRTSTAMEDQNAQLNALFTLSPDGLVAFSADGNVRFANPAFFEMTGIAQTLIEGQSDTVLNEALRKRSAAPAGFPGIAHCFQPLGAALKPMLLELKTPDLKVLQLVGVHSKASSITRILYLRDVTHETEVENMKSEFLSTAAHELRTPMASIYGFSEVLLNQELDENSRKEMLDIIYRQSALMASILNELLDLARIEARRGKDFVLENVMVSALITEVVREFRTPEGRRAPVWLASGTDPAITVDYKKAHQAILNVLSNAYKYSPAGGAVEIQVLSRTSDAATPQVGLRIVDHGIGMTAEQQARVFERFYRADTSGKIPGTGLGMSIVQEIVELHGGSVDLSSQPGAGTTVTLWFPAAPQTPA